MIDDLETLVSDCIHVEELLHRNGAQVIHGTLLRESDEAFRTIAERLEPSGLVPLLTEESGHVELQVRMLAPVKKARPWVNLVLFLTTICTTITAGAILAGTNPFTDPKNLLFGVPFSFALLLILGSHEFGHYFACKSQGIQATLPYFIPVPPPFFLLGTFGAVIRIKGPIRDKKGLLRVGAAGPIVGFLVAIPIVIIGLRLSDFTPLSRMQGHMFLGNSVIFWGLTKLLTQSPPFGYDLSLHPVAFAGWVGMFITALNLLPIGQLDGGHISYAMFGRRSKWIAVPFLAAMVVLGIYWRGWHVWVILVLVLVKVKHPPPLNDVTPLDDSHKIISVISWLIFALTFVPIPFRICG
jgi:membrane-associated protease RseP (regulator of RpoE activity)